MTDRFKKDHATLSPEDKKRFKVAVAKFVGLRVKGVQGADGILEMTWADDGRATFEYGKEQIEGEPHVIWRRVGTHHVSGQRSPSRPLV